MTEVDVNMNNNENIKEQINVIQKELEQLAQKNNFDMYGFETEMNAINEEIKQTHLAHFSKENPFGLHKPRGNPTENTMWHFYDDCEVSYQKGGHAYRRRTEFTWRDPLFSNTVFTLPMKTYCGNETYAIMTEDECLSFHQKVKELIKKYKKT